MFRFFVSEKKENHFFLTQEILNHLKVARQLDKNFICVFDEKFYECKLEGNRALIVNVIEEDHEFKNQVIIAAGILETKGWEFLIQKATELGATKLIPFYSAFTSKKLSGDIDKKLSRWNKIALAASEQSFRNRALEVAKPISFEEVLNIEIENKFLAYEKNGDATQIAFPTNSLFVVGSEGGFSFEEVTNAENKGFKIISLGSRILRAETASIFILARVND